MNDPDIRWKQRLASYEKALAKLVDAVELRRRRELTELERHGLIKAFEFTHELAWNVMKDYFEYQGNAAITGSRDAIREAFRRNLIDQGDGWMETIASRNQSAHTYNEATAKGLEERIARDYAGLFRSFAARMRQLADQAE